MRGKLVLSIVLLSASGLFVGWWITRHPQRLLRGALGPADLAAVPLQSGVPIPDEVRVNLSAGPVSTVQIGIDAPFTVYSFGPLRSSVSGTRLQPSVVSAVPNGFRIGNRQFGGESLEIATERSPAIWVEGHQYRGRVRLLHQPNGKLIVVNVVPLEDYVASVVDSEMPADFPQVARQAQAIVARSYVAFQMQRAKSNPFYDVHSTTRSQNYLGYQYRGRDGRRYAAESASSRLVTEQTAGMICLYEGDLFSTYYTAVCGGETTEGSLVFDDAVAALRSVTCNGCRDAELFRWTQEMPLAQASDLFRRHFASKKKHFGDLVSFHRTALSESIYKPAFEVSDGTRRYRVSALEIRRLFPSGYLHSYRFEARITQGRMVIDGRGHGHGVGLCQWGARGMALEGSGPLEIIRHYYPGVEVVRAR